MLFVNVTNQVRSTSNSNEIHIFILIYPIIFLLGCLQNGIFLSISTTKLEILELLSTDKLHASQHCQLLELCEPECQIELRDH